MTRTRIPTRDEADSNARPIFDAAYKRLGFVPNLLRLTSLSPSALTGLNRMQQSFRDALDAKTRAHIALAVSETNECPYCLATHTYTGMHLAHISPAEVLLARQGKASDKRLAAAGTFTKLVASKRGHVSDSDLAAIRKAGFSDQEILEIIGLTVQYTFTNYINSVFETKIDFPPVPKLEHA